MTFDIFIYLSTLVGGLFVTGTLLCIVLYKWNTKRFFASSLWTKICFWIPMFIVLLAIFTIGFWLSALVSVLLCTLAFKELLTVKKYTTPSMIYFLIISASLLHLPLYFAYFNTHTAIMLLALVVFSSVMSDICAYFFGQFFGKHTLPEFINSKKSYEGVVGQLVGAGIGFILLTPLVGNISLLIIPIIGIASATGDILNSIVKRALAIKDWGSTIPGHGGVLDRFASLSLALACSFMYFKF